MSKTLAPLEVLFDQADGVDVGLTPALEQLYGRLALPAPGNRPWVIGNFVVTLDGVADFAHPKLSGGGQISGYNAHDRALMGILRAVADAVVVGAGTLRSAPRHVWTADDIYPDLAGDFADVRRRLGLPRHPLTVFVTASGGIDFKLRAISSGETPVLIVTTDAGAARLRDQKPPRHVEIVPVGSGRSVSAAAVLEAAGRAHKGRVTLLEGGPRLMGDFFIEDRLDELFLTLAPQVAGRDASAGRPGLVEGRILAPEHPVWGRLVSVRRAESHLLLRYAFN